MYNYKTNISTNQLQRAPSGQDPPQHGIVVQTIIFSKQLDYHHQLPYPTTYALRRG